MKRSVIKRLNKEAEEQEQQVSDSDNDSSDDEIFVPSSQNSQPNKLNLPPPPPSTKSQTTTITTTTTTTSSSSSSSSSNQLKQNEDKIPDNEEEVKPPEKKKVKQNPTILTYFNNNTDNNTNTNITNNNNDTRFVIKKMVLENFKSYAGVQEIGPFDKCFTAVVGPNGSGKSNVLDGLLFVFGKRAKQIRQKRLGELVHESAKFPNLTQASVTVYFYDVMTSTDEVVPQSEIVLRRTVNKKSESAYYLNGRPKKFADIASFLRGKGIDLEHNRFLILQGEVEQIAMMPPKAPVSAVTVTTTNSDGTTTTTTTSSSSSDEGMLDYLEDAIGTAHFIGEIQSATVGLDEINEECAQRERRLALVQDELDALKGPKEDAVEFLNTEAQIFEKKAATALIKRTNAENAAETLGEERDSLNEESAAAQSALETARSALGSAEEEAKTANTMLQKAKELFDKVSGDYNACNNRNAELGEREKHLRGKEKKLKKEISKDEAKATAKAAELEKLREALDEQKRALEELKVRTQEEDEKYERMIPELQKVTGELKRKVEAKEAELLPHKTKAQDLRAQASVHKSEIELIGKTLEERVAAHRQLVASIEDIARDEVRIKDEMDRNARALEDRSRNMRRLRESLAETQEMEGKCGERLRAVAVKLREAKEFKESLKSRGNLYEFITKLKSSIPGIYGRLGDLGEIDKKYDVAITTACKSLDYFVVQTAEAAQKCIQELKRKHVGRTSFIVLDQITKNPSVVNGVRNKYTPPKDSERLYDLVHIFDDRFKAAFYWALTNTLVVADTDTAARIGYGDRVRHRVVTLAGSLVEVDGTMSGGGNRVFKGGMNLKGSRSSFMSSLDSSTAGIDAKGIEKLEREHSEIEREFADIRKRRLSIENEIGKLEALSATSNEKLNMDLQERVHQRKELEKAVLANGGKDTLPTLDAAQQSRLEELERLVASCEAEASEVEKTVRRLEKAIAPLRAEIMEKGGSKLAEQKKIVVELQKAIKEAESAINTAAFNQGQAEKVIAKCNASAEKSKKALESVQDEIKGIIKDRDELIVHGTAVIKEFDNAKKDVEEKEEVLKSKQNALDEQKAEFSKFLKSASDITAKLQAITAKIADQEKLALIQSEAIKILARKWAERKLILAGKNANPLINDDDNDDNNNKDENDENEMEVEDEVENVDNENVDGKKESNEGSKNGKDKEGNGDGVEDEESKKEFMKRIEEEASRSSQNIDDLNVEIRQLEQSKSNMNPNISAIKKYLSKESEFTLKRDDLDSARSKRDEIRLKIDNLKAMRFNQFMAGFEQINLKLKELYTMITGEGSAELELINKSDPFSEGVNFSVRPPKKAWKTISNLSGGERTISSLSLIFALHQFKPTPIYVMDEIDAALDFRNVSVIANYIKEKTTDAQFIVISLRNYMFEQADRLVGIYKINDCTSSIAITPADYSSSLKTTKKEEGGEEEEGK